MSSNYYSAIWVKPRKASFSNAQNVLLALAENFSCNDILKIEERESWDEDKETVPYFYIIHVKYSVGGGYSRVQFIKDVVDEFAKYNLDVQEMTAYLVEDIGGVHGSYSEGKYEGHAKVKYLGTAEPKLKDD